MTKLILVIFIALGQCMKDMQTQTINLSGRQEKEQRFLLTFLLNFQNVGGLNKDISTERYANTRSHISRKFFKKPLSNRYARATKKEDGFIELQLKMTQLDGGTLKTMPIIVYGQGYISKYNSSNFIWEPRSRLIRFC